MKTITAGIVAFALALGSNTAAAAPASNEVQYITSYAEAFMYCNNVIGLSNAGGNVFDNDARCLDASDLIFDDPDGWYDTLMQMYPGGINNWRVNAGNQKCVFQIYLGQPYIDERLALEVMFAVCAVRLRKEVTPAWYLTDTEDASIEKILVDPEYIASINAAAARLIPRFRKPFKTWMKHSKYALNITVASSPVASKLYLQKWVDYKWIVVKTIERHSEPRLTYKYKTKEGRYRLVGKSLGGVQYVSKTVTIG